MSGSQPIQADEATLESVRKEFRGFETDFDALRTAVVRDAALVRSGAGQFEDLVTPGANTYEASWLMVTRVASTSAETVAGNVGRMKLDLSTMDALT
ncbi:hypothetical protein [Nocardioides daphniae]|uniref:Uncharacterized protein n=1 Tax=Nocardioides daphniae TaxID=402297 RepID=A0ABQ1Q1R0_9ACTN|nr:hypothetical protein [Nocardioides daphniae]GGD09776.1 hypothetical protein GCM10007231_05780 [Nocardioides daphniae]